MLVQATRKPSRVARSRDPERTRQQLLQAAFQEVYKYGFQSADLDSILGKAGVTKGALYHHFENKEALGYAVVEDLLSAMTHEKWVAPLENVRNPIDALIGIFESDGLTVRGGCPLNNLAQEMSAIDEGFRKRLARVFGVWRDGMAQALRLGQKNGTVRQDVDVQETATFLIALYEGYISLGKNSQDPKVLASGHKHLIRYLETLRETKGHK